MNEIRKKIAIIILLALVTIILYHNPLFSNKPLGLDAVGHLSKVEYYKEFPGKNWDMAWYAGTPFLKFYPPAWYYLVALPPNIFFGTNALAVLGIFLISLSIFLLVKEITKKNIPALIAALLFLTVLCTSYYYIAVGNYPYLFSLWTIPLCLFLLERSFEKKIYRGLFAICLATGMLIHIFSALCIIPLAIARVITKKKLSKESIKILVQCIAPALLVTSFWLVPFLTKSSDFGGDSAGYVPTPTHLAGFGGYTIWGKAPGEIGIALVFFIISIIMLPKKYKNNYILFSGIASLCFLALVAGILGNNYPAGYGAIRFIMPFAILSCIYGGATISSVKISRKIMAIIMLLIAIGLVWNYIRINENYTQFSHAEEGSRIKFMERLLENEKFPVKNEFMNYRFGTDHYIFSETLNFFYPRAPQTFGYADQGILFPKTVALANEEIFKSQNSNTTEFYINWFGIKYLEVEGKDEKIKKKYNDNLKFKKIMADEYGGYSFIIYEYQDPSPIISLIRGNIYNIPHMTMEDVHELAKINKGSKKAIPLDTTENITYRNEYRILNYTWIRDNPDKIRIIPNEEIKKGDSALIREFYHKSWHAYELPSRKNLKIYEAGPRFMLVFPSEEAREIIIEQKKTKEEIIGIILSIGGICWAGIIIASKKQQKSPPQSI